MIQNFKNVFLLSNFIKIMGNWKLTFSMFCIDFYIDVIDTLKIEIRCMTLYNLYTQSVEIQYTILTESVYLHY